MKSAIISQQGSAGNPSDNEWQAGWGGNNGTWTDANTFPATSPLYIRSGGVYTPPFNANEVFHRLLRKLILLEPTLYLSRMDLSSLVQAAVADAQPVTPD